MSNAGENQMDFPIVSTRFLFYDGFGCDLCNTTPNFTPKALAPRHGALFCWLYLTNFQSSFCA